METMAVRSETGVASQTEVLESQRELATSSQPVLRLRLKKPKNDRKVGWREDTVDNEDMGRKKSKCCCIYKKPVAFGESSSESDEECEHCFGHPEKRRKNIKKHHHKHDHEGDSDTEPEDDKDPKCEGTPKGDGGGGSEPDSESKPSAAPE